MRILLQPAYILHRRAYRETSLLLELITQEYGRITLLARGVRAPRSPLRSLLQPFIPLTVSWQGKTELMTLTAAEASAAPMLLTGDCLLSGFYLNELLIRVLQKNDPQPQIFAIYQQTLQALQSNTLEQKTLRLFEKKLLAELGYGVQLQQDFMTGKPIEAEPFYQFFPEQGFTICSDAALHSSAWVFSGKALLAFAAEQLTDEESLREAKRLMRMLFGSLLNGQPLHSRKLFSARKENEEYQ